MSLKHIEKRDRRGRGLERPKVPAPGPRARPAREVWRKWGVRGLGASGAVFVVRLPSSRSATRADGRYGGFQGGRARFLSP